MNPKYNYNPLLLWFKNHETERNFNLSRFKEDLNALRFVIILGATLSIVFIFVDVSRYESSLVSIAFRGGMALLLIVIGGFTFLFRQKHYKLSQFNGVFIALFVSATFFFHYHSNTDESFRIFLPNILTVLIFVISTIMGMRFRHALLVNSVNFIAYILYIQNINYSQIAERQISQLFVIYSIGILASYLLEREKIASFINKNELNLEIAKVAELDKVKNKLFSIISHDLRGPIVSLKGIVSLYKMDAISDEEFKRLNRTLEDALDNSSYLLDNLLAWSKSQMEGLVLKKTVINLGEELSNLNKLFASQLKAKGIALELSIAHDQQIQADRETTQIVFRNLLSNAIKFTPHGGNISISAKEVTNQMIEIQISDSGVGMERAKLGHLFEINKESLIGDTSSNGAGIGLLLVKEFVDLNGGSVSVESEIGKGTNFKLTLPTQ